ncbi:MAG TPA: hypothetical protein VMS88_01890, partial [Terriglobales bacterium]|nr:hypothetical protein [Terriglobales bacterium]
MNRAAALVALVLLSLSFPGCGTRSINSPLPVLPPSSIGPRDSTFSDAVIQRAAYSSHPWPDGFYHEDDPGGIAPY